MLARTFLFLATATLAAAQGGKPTTIEIHTLAGQMKYDTSSFEVAPGAKVRLVLHNDDDMHHNIVICKPGKDNEQEVAKAAWKLGGDGFEKNWIPEHPLLLFACPMADPKSSVTLEFVAPQDVGTYPYVCTLPGHSMLMRGEMIVGGGAGGSDSGLSDLKFMLYEGSWDKLPDFTKLTPSGTDHVPGGLIDLKVASKLSGGFGVVFSGTIEAPADGRYKFRLGSDDGSRLKVDGREVVAIDGIHALQAKGGTAELKKGAHSIELEYFDGGGQRELALSWSGPGFRQRWLSVGQEKKPQQSAPAGIPLAPTETEAIIYRNFIAGAGSRAIGVGYPGGVNLAYDADQMRIALVWQGAFIDAARHWRDRGTGSQPPLGYNVYPTVEGTPFARLASAGEPWPDNARKNSRQQPDNGYVFKGYQLVGDSRSPEFHFLLEDMVVTDMPVPKGSPKTNDSAIDRTITISGHNTGGDNLYFRAASGSTIEKLDDGRFSIDGVIRIALVSAEGSGPVVRDIGGRQELLIPVRFHDGKAQLRQTFSWN